MGSLGLSRKLISVSRLAIECCSTPSSCTQVVSFLMCVLYVVPMIPYRSEVRTRPDQMAFSIYKSVYGLRDFASASHNMVKQAIINDDP